MKTLLAVIAALVLLACSPSVLAQHNVALSYTQAVVQPTTPPGTCPGSGSYLTITGNQLLRGTASGAEAVIQTSSAPVVAFADTAVIAGMTYFYEVTAGNCNGFGKVSNEISVTIPNPVVPSAPTGLQVTAVADNKTANPQIFSRTLQWNTVNFGGQLVYYNVRREDTGKNNWLVLNSTPMAFPTFFDDTEKKGGQYGYQVQAWTLSAGGGSWSPTLFTGVTN